MDLAGFTEVFGKEYEGEAMCSPATIITHLGIFSVEDFNDLYFIPQGNAGRPPLGAGLAIVRYVKQLAAGGPAQELEPTIETASSVLRSLGLEDVPAGTRARSQLLSSMRFPAKSQQLVRGGIYVPRYRPRLYAVGQRVDRSQGQTFDQERWKRGVTRADLPSSARRATLDAVKRCQRYGGLVYARSPADNRWRRARVEGMLEFSGEVYVKYIDIGRSERVPMHSLRLADGADKSQARVDPHRAPSYRTGNEPSDFETDVAPFEAPLSAAEAKVAPATNPAFRRMVESADPYGIRLARGLRRDEVRGSYSPATTDTPLRRGTRLLAQSKRDDLVRVAEVISFSRERQTAKVEYLGGWRSPPDETLPFSRLLITDK